ncbi:MAG: PadR family transcriptional regulator [Lachnospiraceae bacterium]
MVFNTGAALLDAIVLATVSKEDQGTYGYKITQDVRNILDISESTLYPVLRRLQNDGYLETYDQEYNGRNRRYYRISATGLSKLAEYILAWNDYSFKITQLFTGEEIA